MRARVKPIRSAWASAAIALSGIALLTAGSLAPIAETEQRSEAGTACEDAAIALADSQGLASGGVDFACIDTGEVTVETASGASVSAFSADVAAEADDGQSCRIDGQASIQKILSQTHEGMQFCIFYGRSGQWMENIELRVDINLQFDSHQVSFRTLGGGSFTASLTGSVSYYSHPNPLEVRLADATSFRFTDAFTPRLAATAWPGAGFPEPEAGARTMFIRLENLNVTQPAYGFDVNVSNTMTSSRFVCYWSLEQCIWPNAQEAPFFGGAGR